MINLQVESRHKEFFGVMCLHSYYSDHVTRDLEFEPTPETAQLLRNYQLIFKPVSFGFLVLYNPGFSESRLRGIPPKTRLSFHVKSLNRRFMNFTQVPFWPEGVAFHFSNLSGFEREFTYDIPRDVYYYFRGLKVGDVRKKLLHLPEHALLSQRSKLFHYALQQDSAGAKGVSYDDVTIKDEWGETHLKDGVPYKKRFRDAQKDLFRRHLDHATRNLGREGLSVSEKEKRTIEIADALEKELSKQETTDFGFDLRHAPHGRYKIHFGDFPPREVYVAERPESQIFGILDIHLDAPKDALLNRDAKEDEGVVNPTLFHIHFEARNTYWRYIFMNYENSKITPKHIRDENNQLAFSSPVEGKLEQVGTEMMVSESASPIRLKDRPEHVLFLARMNGKRSIKEIRLPTPGPEMVKPEKVAGKEEKIYSEIYVYI